MKYFVPQVINIKGVQVPSTPYSDKDNKPIFLGDVFKVVYLEDGKTTTEVFVASFEKSTYVGVCNGSIEPVPMWMVEMGETTVIGSSEENPELLKLLTD